MKFQQNFFSFEVPFLMFHPIHLYALLFTSDHSMEKHKHSKDEDQTTLYLKAPGEVLRPHLLGPYKVIF